jgi:hypothetical protein
MPPSTDAAYFSDSGTSMSSCSRTGLNQVQVEKQQQMPQQQQQMPQQQQQQQMPQVRKNPAYWESAEPSPLQPRRHSFVDYDSDLEAVSCSNDASKYSNAFSSTGSCASQTQSSTRSSGSCGSSHTRSTKHANAAEEIRNDIDNEEYYRHQNQYQNQIQYYPEDVEADDINDITM